MIKLGDKGSPVSDLQSNLNVRGFKCLVDGDFGPATERAVKAFQSSRGLEMDGIVGPKTMKALGFGIEPKPIKIVPITPKPSLDVGKNRNYYPEAVTKVAKMKSQGKYKKGHPRGAVIHWTEGHQTQKIEDAISYGASKGYAYMFIDYLGGVGQSLPFTDWGSHAGVSSWKEIGTGVSDDLVGIEVACAGKLKKTGSGWKSEFGTIIPSQQVIEGSLKANCKAGAYQKYTKAQFESLVRLLLWLKNNNPEVFSFDLVVGHDEVAPTRKTDPGWSLGMTMPEFRQELKKRHSEKSIAL